MMCVKPETDSEDTRAPILINGCTCGTYEPVSKSAKTLNSLVMPKQTKQGNKLAKKEQSEGGIHSHGKQ